ncbi:MAG: lipopolysaccharide/colanic/teichoic acid biosynthesis glycosyltransferase [Paracoccaceae bacterium]|jgi:lipopolysaccharide/colanic/teichoic acid biosynthesis glycosyltransferase
MKNYSHEKAPKALMLHTDIVGQTGRSYGMYLSVRAAKDELYAPLAQPSQKYDHAQYIDWGKQALDSLIVLLLLPAAAVLIGVCAIALWLEGGQPFYRQVRLGRYGRKFSILKLRTMVRDADQRLETCLAADPELRKEWDSTQKLKIDPRITRVGAFLRQTSLDELPQIWNVIKGEMSLVGPRPMLPEQLPLYGDARPYFAMRPGITGSWQVSARNEKGFAHRAVVDAEYYHKVSMKVDLKLLFKTIAVILQRTGY